MTKRRVAGVILVTLTVWCQAETASAQPTGSLPAAEPATATETRRLEFARRYETAVNERDAAEVNRCFDMKAFTDAVFEGMTVPRATRAGFIAGLRSTFDWGTATVAAVGVNGHYKLLDTFEREGRHVARYRLINNDGGLNYHDIEMAVSREGSWRIVDAYVFISGEDLTQMARRMLSNALKPGTLGQVPPATQAIMQMQELVEQGQFVEAFNLYSRLPEEAQREKTVHLQRILCAGQIGDKAIVEACEAFRRDFPDDACVDLLTIDQLFVQRRWDQAIAALKRIKRSVGGDPFLDYLAALVYAEAGKVDLAKAKLQVAKTAEPTLEEPHWTTIAIALEENDFPTVARSLRTLEKQFGYVFDDLREVQQYRGFVASDEYRQWVSEARND
ncbi:MAG: tetratricopeptide repeat protein [Planctomycetota bacterium]|jgi:hypothetical protein